MTSECASIDTHWRVSCDEGKGFSVSLKIQDVFRVQKVSRRARVCFLFFFRNSFLSHAQEFLKKETVLSVRVSRGAVGRALDLRLSFFVYISGMQFLSRTQAKRIPVSSLRLFSAHWNAHVRDAASPPMPQPGGEEERGGCAR